MQPRHLLCNLNYAEKLRHSGASLKPRHRLSDGRDCVVVLTGACVSVCLGPHPSLPADTGACLVPLCRPQLSQSREWQKGEFDLSMLETAWLSAFPFLSALAEDAVTLPNYLESSVLEVFPMGCL